jgi:hypothetical protein
MCLFDLRDFRHADARTFYDTAPIRLTHNYVLAELVALTHARGAPRGRLWTSSPTFKTTQTLR